MSSDPIFELTTRSPHPDSTGGFAPFEPVAGAPSTGAFPVVEPVRAARAPLPRRPVPRTGPADFSDLTPLLRQPPRRTVKAERYDRMHPVTAGAVAGGAGGLLMLVTANRLLRLQPDAVDLGAYLGRIVSRGALAGLESQLAGFGAALVVGALLGAIFAMTTRHLRRFAPLVIWSLVFFPATWTMLYALVIPRLAPWLLPMLPFAPMVAGIAVFGFFASLQLPLRTGSRPVFQVEFDVED